MKTLATVFLSITLALSVHAQNWNLIGPDTANISRVEFAIAPQQHVFCADNGFYLYHYGNNTCEFFTNGGLPVTGAWYYDQNKIIIAMGDGSWSDGIYTFNVNTHELEVAEWIVTPNFLHFHEANSTYWVGSDWGGMWRSTDGINWEEVLDFSAKPCISIASLGDHMVVNLISDLTNAYWSDDSGETWFPSELAPLFPNMNFHYSGLLLGIFPGYSNSSGVWKSEDFGNTWNNLIYHDNLTSVCFDVFSDIMVGSDGEGIGKFSETTGIEFMNEGLPCLHINNIQVNPTMSAPALFVSTDEGVYFSYDYYVGMNDRMISGQEIKISPNPAHDFLAIKADHQIQKIEIFDLSGRETLNCLPDPTNETIDISNLEKGLYLISLQTAGSCQTIKFVKQ